MKIFFSKNFLFSWQLSLFLIASVLASNIVELSAKPLGEKASELLDSCENGDAESCVKLGISYSIGNMVELDVDKAIKYYKKGCDGDNGNGCLREASIYFAAALYNKKLVEFPDDKYIFGLVFKACDLGVSKACASIAGSYANDDILPKDLVKAAKYIKAACEGGVGEGCTLLGSHYRNGTGVVKDLKKAKDYTKKGCQLGDKNACKSLQHSK